MKKIILIIGISIVLIVIGFFYFKNDKVLSPLGVGKVFEDKKLLQYTYLALQKTNFPGSEIKIGKLIKDNDTFISYLFYYQVGEKKVSGLMNVPKKSGNYPVIVMIRGYADEKTYQSGVGTSHGGELMAQNDFITLAPDFLGYGESDKGSSDPLEDRFLTYETVLQLFSSIKNLNAALENKSLEARYDGTHIGVWGHSNGGQIALSVLETSGYDYPTVLWAPVSKPFPYSILYYTDEADDHGKSLIKLVADFESKYDAEKYSLTNYFDWIKAPLQIHQGVIDEEVPVRWSDELVLTLKDKDKEVEYFTYPSENHNFNDQEGWGLAMSRTMAFYKKLMKK